jgi:hypothetical protein
MDDQTAKSPQLLAIGLVQDARAYVESARTLASLHGRAPKSSAPMYFLLGQAMELVLKAHLSASGVSMRTLRHCIRHDIALAFRYARRCFSFTPADERFAELVAWLAPYHRDHSFRYRKSGYRQLPLASEAAEIITNAVDGVDPFVRRQFLSMREYSRSYRK